MESSKGTGCRAREGPILCINSCGFLPHEYVFQVSQGHDSEAGSGKTCSCLHQNIVNGSSRSNEKEHIPTDAMNTQVKSAEASSDLISQCPKVKPQEDRSKCTACRKRVGLTGFSCKCVNLFCAVNRYSDKHDCPFDYRNAGCDAIAKANPFCLAEKLNKM